MHVACVETEDSLLRYDSNRQYDCARILARIADTAIGARCKLLLHMLHEAWFVCLCVGRFGRNCELCKNG